MPTLKSIVAAALAEDIGRGDVTTEAAVSPSTRAIGRLVARQRAVVAGLDVAREVFRQVGGTVWRTRAEDGDTVRSGQVVAEIHGRARSILTGERVALNFLQRLSGTATLTRAFEDDLKRSKTWTAEEWRRRPFYNKILEGFWALFAEIF